MVSDISNHNTISVFVEHLPDDLVTIARFDWNTDGAPGEDKRPSPTYTIDLSDTVSVELDRHWPVRPTQVSWHTEPEEVGCEALIEDVFGETLPAAMQQARRGGYMMLALTLDKESRQKIAELQDRSPSTPAALRKLCRVMLDELSKSQPNGEAVT